MLWDIGDALEVEAKGGSGTCRIVHGPQDAPPELAVRLLGLGLFQRDDLRLGQYRTSWGTGHLCQIKFWLMQLMGFGRTLNYSHSPLPGSCLSTS
jgi:hypothetical protein